MTLTATVGVGVVPRVTIDTATPGLPVFGVTAGGARWEAVKAFPGHRVVDYQAPLNQTFWYEQGADRSASLLREARCSTALTSLDGKLVVPFIMPHAWEDVTDPDVKLFQTAGRVWHVAGRAPKIGVRQLEVRAEGAHVGTMRALIRSGQGVVFLHSCPVPLCPVPGVVVGVIVSAPGSLAPRVDVGEMIFSVEFQERRFPGVVAANSWADVAAGFADWADVLARGSWADVRDGV